MREVCEKLPMMKVLASFPELSAVMNEMADYCNHEEDAQVASQAIELRCKALNRQRKAGKFRNKPEAIVGFDKAASRVQTSLSSIRARCRGAAIQRRMNAYLDNPRHAYFFAELQKQLVSVALSSAPQEEGMCLTRVALEKGWDNVRWTRRGSTVVREEILRFRREAAAYGVQDAVYEALRPSPQLPPPAPGSEDYLHDLGLMLMKWKEVASIQKAQRKRPLAVQIPEITQKPAKQSRRTGIRSLADYQGLPLPDEFDTSKTAMANASSTRCSSGSGSVQHYSIASDVGSSSGDASDAGSDRLDTQMECFRKFMELFEQIGECPIPDHAISQFL
jgi:hypothetical protein